MYFKDSKEINEVYIKLDSLFKLKIKAQLKGTGLIFDKFCRSRDLVNQEEFYSLVINRKSFDFNNLLEFYIGLAKIINCEEQKVKNQIEQYEQHKAVQLAPEIADMFYSIDSLYDKEYKLDRLKTRLMAYITKESV